MRVPYCGDPHLRRGRVLRYSASKLRRNIWCWALVHITEEQVGWYRCWAGRVACCYVDLWCCVFVLVGRGVTPPLGRYYAVSGISAVATWGLSAHLHHLHRGRVLRRYYHTEWFRASKALGLLPFFVSGQRVFSPLCRFYAASGLTWKEASACGITDGWALVDVPLHVERHLHNRGRLFFRGHFLPRQE